MTPPRKHVSRAGRQGHGRITVIAGVNGAGKSSVVGATIREFGGRYFNPDEAARSILVARPGVSQEEANGIAWEMGRRGLEQAIARQEYFTFETTLGGRTIAGLLSQALSAGLEVVVIYVGLDSLDRHIARVRARVAFGGHDIPDATIRARWRMSRENLIALLPRLTELSVYDNSTERDPNRGEAPVLTLLLRMVSGRIEFIAPKESIPSWAHPVVAAAILSGRERRGEE